jgi:mxaL protein
MARYPGRAERHAVIALHAWRFWAQCAALLVLLAGLSAGSLRWERRVFDVVAVLDITGSMNVTDQMLDGHKATRIDMERHAMHDLLAALPCGSRLGLAVFVERQPFLLFRPVETCGNFPALDAEIAAIDWRMGWDSESHISEALLASMDMARHENADLVFMTDGQETPPLWWSAAPSFTAARGSVGGLIAGIGSPGFSPIPKFDAYGRQTGFFRPGDVPSERDGMFRGREHLSALDEPHLKALGAASGLAYIHLQEADGILPALTFETSPRRVLGPVDILWGFAALALGLLAIAAGPGPEVWTILRGRNAWKPPFQSRVWKWGAGRH